MFSAGTHDSGESRSLALLVPACTGKGLRDTARAAVGVISAADRSSSTSYYAANQRPWGQLISAGIYLRNLVDGGIFYVV